MAVFRGDLGSLETNDGAQCEMRSAWPSHTPSIAFESFLNRDPALPSRERERRSRDRAAIIFGRIFGRILGCISWGARTLSLSLSLSLSRHAAAHPYPAKRLRAPSFISFRVRWSPGRRKEQIESAGSHGLEALLESTKLVVSHRHDGVSAHTLARYVRKARWNVLERERIASVFFFLLSALSRSRRAPMCRSRW